MQPGLLGALMPQEDILAPVPLVPRGLIDAMGPSVMARMGEADRQQQARWQAGERAPMPLTEENMWLADDVAGGLLGPIGMAGIVGDLAEDLPGKIARLLREGRASEVTDDMLGLLDANQNARLVELYESGATGQAMPMDEASRMGRAASMGLGTDAYHGTTSDFPAFTRSDGGNMWGNYPYVASSPDDAASYATGWHNRITPQGNAAPNVIPTRIPSSGLFDMDAPMSKRDMRKITDPLDTPDGYYRYTIADRMGPRNGQGLWQTLHFNEMEPASEIIRRHGYSGITEAADGMAGSPGTQTTMIFDPANIRSRFARFDPRLAKNANLLASVGGAGLLGLLALPDDYAP